MEQLQEFHVLDRILHYRNKHHICYYNSRAVKFGPTIRPLEGRSRSEKKIAPYLMTKKRLLMDEQLIQFKMVIRENQKNTDQLIREGQSKEDLDRLNDLRCQTQQLFKDFQHQCREKSFILERHERNLSEPKYKQTTIPAKYKKQAFKRCMGFQHLEDNSSYFLRCSKDLQNRIIYCRQIFSLFTNHKEDTIPGRTEELWMQLIICLQEIKKQAILSEFSPWLMTNDLQQHKNAITQEQSNALKMLFEDKLVTTKRMLKRRRIGQLMNLAHALEIQVEENHSFDFKKIAQTYRQLRQKYDIRHPIGLLLLIKKIEPILSQHCDNGRCYSVEYYIGLKKLYRCGNHA